MQKILITLLLFVSIISYGQKGRFKPFKLIVLKPDTAIIDETLYPDIDTIRANYLSRYYSYVQQIEQRINSKNFPEESGKATQERFKAELAALKILEPEVKKFKYYHAFSAYSIEFYGVYFNKYEPYSTIIEFPSQKTDILSLSKLADTSKSDYIIFFNNIHTEIKNGFPILKLTTSLYSKKEKKIILRKETECDTFSRGVMWTCGGVTLSCLLTNCIMTSAGEVTPLIIKRQLRH